MYKYFRQHGLSDYLNFPVVYAGLFHFCPPFLHNSIIRQIAIVLNGRDQCLLILRESNAQARLGGRIYRTLARLCIREPAFTHCFKEYSVCIL